MGRKKKYKTEKDKNDAQKRWVMEYYKRNKEKLQKINLKRYYERKSKRNN